MKRAALDMASVRGKQETEEIRKKAAVTDYIQSHSLFIHINLLIVLHL